MTQETLKNPSVVTIPDPTGLDLAIYYLQTRIAQLEWLQKSFGRAFTMPVRVREEKRLEPMVYQGGGEYYNVMPNDALRSYSFWRVRGKRGVNEWVPLNNHGNFFLSDTVDLIVWCDLKAVDPSKDYNFKEVLIRDVFRYLDDLNNVVVTGVFDDKVEDIFSGYTLQPNHRDMLMFPYTAFRVEMTVSYGVECDPAMIPVPAGPLPIQATEGDMIMFINGKWQKISLQYLQTKLQDVPIG